MVDCKQNYKLCIKHFYVLKFTNMAAVRNIDVMSWHINGALNWKS
jgi:hypothetical protein